MKNRFYVYTYLDPRRSGRYCYNEMCFLYEPIYIGKGQGTRHLHHLKRLERHVNGHFKNKLLKILQSEFDGFDMQSYILVVRSSLLEYEAFNLEKQLIREVGRADLNLGPLTNLTDGGEGSSNPSRHVRLKISASHKSRKLSEEHKEKLRQANLGKKLSQETKQKIAKASASREHSEETKQKMHKPKSEETKQKISEARKGMTFSEEHKRNMSLVRLGAKHSDGTKRKIAEGNRGKMVSAETKEKMREARLAVLQRSAEKQLKDSPADDEFE